MSAYLYAVTCTPDSLSAAAPTEETVSRLQEYFLANNILQPQSTLDDLLLQYLYRVVVSPHSLTLSIAAPFLAAAREICIGPPSPAEAGVDVLLWMQSQKVEQKLKELPPAGDMAKGIPADAATLNLIIVPSDVFQQWGFAVSAPPLQWPAVPAQQSPEEPSLQYLDDDLAARVSVSVMKGVQKVIAAKKREIEQNVKTVDLTSQVSAAVAQTLKEMQAQLLVKDLPQLQLPVFRIEEDKSVAQQLHAFDASTKQLLEEVKKLKEASNQW